MLAEARGGLPATPPGFDTPGTTGGRADPTTAAELPVAACLAMTGSLGVEDEGVGTEDEAAPVLLSDTFGRDGAAPPDPGPLGPSLLVGIPGSDFLAPDPADRADTRVAMSGPEFDDGTGPADRIPPPISPARLSTALSAPPTPDRPFAAIAPALVRVVMTLPCGPAPGPVRAPGSAAPVRRLTAERASGPTPGTLPAARFFMCSCTISALILQP